MTPTNAPPDRTALLLATLERLLALQTMSVDDTLNQTAHIISETLNAEKVDVFLPDPATNTLIAMGSSKTPLSDRQHSLGLHRLPIANGGTEVEVFQTGEVYVTGQAEQDPRVLQGVKSTEGLAVRSMLEVPLDVAGERRGVLAISSMQPHRFNDDDVAFTQAAARWVGMLIERTEIAERVAQQAAASARRLAAEELISVFSHDMGNLLTPLVGRVYMLLQSVQKDNRTTDVANIQAIIQSLQRARSLLDDLLNVERIERGLFTLTYQPVDLTALVTNTVELARSDKHVIDLRVPEQCLIIADPDRLLQAIENLIHNALKYTPQGLPIVVEVTRQQRRDGEWAMLTVQDSGPGIAPDLLPRIFDRFVRSEGSQGLGLGLFLAQRIAEAHNGSLTVESTPGIGATFTVALPCEQYRS